MTGAAERASVSPSAMSESVKILENHSGESLLERRRFGVVPTSTGLTLYEHARVMSDAAEKALNMGFDNSPQEKVKISMPIELACGWFHSVFAEHQSAVNATQLTIMCEDEMLDHERYSRDLFIRAAGIGLTSKMNVLHEHQTSAVFAAHPTLLANLNANRLADIQKLPLLCKPRLGSSTTLKLPKYKARTSVSSVRSDKQEHLELVFKRAMYVNDIQTRISLARSGLGVVGCIEHTL